MLRKFISAAALFGVAACTSTGTADPAVISSAQNIAVAACGFLPTVQTVTDILAKGNAALSTAEQVATAICAAVTPATATTTTTTTTASASRKRAAAAPPAIDGIPIVGSFVK